MATVEIELSDAELVTLTATIGSCILLGMERHLPPKAALRTRIMKVEDAIKSLAQLMRLPNGRMARKEMAA